VARRFDDNGVAGRALRYLAQAIEPKARCRRTRRRRSIMIVEFNDNCSGYDDIERVLHKAQELARGDAAPMATIDFWLLREDHTRPACRAFRHTSRRAGLDGHMIDRSQHTKDPQCSWDQRQQGRGHDSQYHGRESMVSSSSPRRSGRGLVPLRNQSRHPETAAFNEASAAATSMAKPLGPKDWDRAIKRSL
jgi:hypothetical protein